MARLAAGEAVSILDVRWQLSEPDGSTVYRQGHIPGAVHVSLEDELSDHSVTGRGRHPLPTGQAVAAAASWGLRQGIPVVAYDDWNRAGSAARGECSPRRDSRRPDPRRRPGGSAVRRRRAGHRCAATAARRCDGAPRGPVCRRAADADRRTGGRSSRNPAGRPCARTFPRRRRTGGPGCRPHPRAHNLPSTSVLDDDGSFLSGAELDAVLSVAGISDATGAGVYCGSGITAARGGSRALAAAGRHPALFPGSVVAVEFGSGAPGRRSDRSRRTDAHALLYLASS